MWRRRQQCKFLPLPCIPLPHRSLVCILCHSISRGSNYFEGMHRQLHLRLLRVSRRPLQIAIERNVETRKKAIPRKAAGQTWRIPLLQIGQKNDYRLFCGDLGYEVNDDVLSKTFSRFPSFKMDRVVRDKRTGKTKGYEFVSFANPADLAAALKEMNAAN